MPNLVGRDAQLSAANSLSQLVGGVIRLIGGPVGGVLYVLCGFRYVVAIDVASYLLSAALSALIRYRAQPRPQQAASDRPVRASLRFRSELRAGLAHIRHAPDLSILFAVATLFFTGNAILTALLVPYLSGVLHAGAQSLGVLFGALGLGYAVGGPVSRLVTDRISDRAATAASLTVLAVVFAVAFNIPHLTWDVALFTLIGPPAVCFLVTLTRLSPEGLRTTSKAA